MGKDRPDMEHRMSVEEVANELDITPARVYEYCQAGRLGRRVGGRWHITRKEFERFKREEYTGKPGRPPLPE